MSEIDRPESNVEEVVTRPPPPRQRRPGTFQPSGPPRLPRLNLGRLLVLLVVLAYPFYYWFIVRVEVNANQLLVLVNKTGRTLPADQEQYRDQIVLYPELVADVARQTGWSEEKVRNSYKGIRYEVLREGRYFFSPIWYERIKIDTTLIPESQFGVLIRKYGKPLPAGKTVATLPDERGPVAGTLPPGRHDLNRLAYEVQTFNKIIVPEGWTGVQTKLSGEGPTDPNDYVQPKGARGVQPGTLGPGTYFDLNPYEVRVDLVDVRSQRYDMLGDEAIEFPSNDGFTIRMEATVEWAVYADQVPALTVEVGDLEDVVTKVIRPYAMSLARIQGSKMTARDFIGARETFQRRIVADLRARCRDQGVLIKAVNVRELRPPEAVRSVIRERELADQTMTRYENEIAEAKAKAQLVEQEQLANQQQAVGDANRQVVSVTVDAQQTMAVAVTEANQRLDVAKLVLEAARRQAEAILSRGQADAKVVLFNYEAKAKPLQAAVSAFGDGYTYARYTFLQKMAPAIRSVLTNTEGPFADVIREFSDSGTKGAAK
ncbi:MAG: hypothetical protein HY718_06115 [Planctomycetes bacterium]|nr:hypothetical protein [Planctomycetota bacterium]